MRDVTLPKYLTTSQEDAGLLGNPASRPDDEIPDPPKLPSFGGQPNLREQISDALRSALITGSLRPGMLYSAPMLAAQFGVSPTPVREAMLDLAQEGLVCIVRNKGFRVTQLSERDLDEIVELRRLIEIPTVRQLALNADSSLIEALRPLARAIEVAAEDRDPITLIHADTAFHLELLALSNNGHLVQLIRDLRMRSRLYQLPALAGSGELSPSIAEHSELLNLLIARNAENAADLMRRHIDHVRGLWS